MDIYADFTSTLEVMTDDLLDNGTTVKLVEIDNNWSSIN